MKWKPRMRLGTLVGTGLWTMLVGCAADTLEGDEDLVGQKVEPLCRTGTLWPNGVIPVCWTATATNHSDFATMSVRVRADVEGSWQRFAGVRFTGWAACGANTNGMVRISLVNNARPNAGGIGYSSSGLHMTLDPKRVDQRAVAIHEFGHVLGYRHEFVRQDNPNNGSCNLQNGESADSSCDYEGTGFDANSIMGSTGYCQNNPTLSQGDVQGTREAYGPKGEYVSGVTSQDYDGDGKADQVLFRAPNWYIRKSSGGSDIVINLGTTTDRPVPGDYDGDGKTDAAVFRPSNGTWYVRRSGGGADLVIQFGTSTDIQVPGDYDGDGKTDVAVFRPSNGKWYARRSGGGADLVHTFGVASDTVVPGDYDGDGLTDPAVFRPSNGFWYVRRSGGGADLVIDFGQPSDVPLPGDYDGDGKTDASVFRPSNGVWYARRSGGGSDLTQTWGDASDRFLPADYNGDGSTDYAVFRPFSEQWRVRYRGTTSGFNNVFGVISDVFPNSR